MAADVVSTFGKTPQPADDRVADACGAPLLEPVRHLLLRVLRGLEHGPPELVVEDGLAVAGLGAELGSERLPELFDELRREPMGFLAA
jgi:hypothetical protein